MGYLPGLYDIFQERWGQSQSCYIYSDPHFSDEDLEYGIKNRPSDEEQIRRINAKAGRRDTLIILGDVGNIECVRKLRAGRKVLICGNHDLGATRYKREVVKEIYDKDKMTREEAVADMQAKYPGWKVWAHEDYAFHSPFERWNVYADNMLFDEVYEGALIVGERLILSHEPVEIPWLYNIHGHDHAGRKRVNHLNVCSDVIGYEPVNLTQLLKTGLMSRIETIHRMTIDKATEKKKKRGGRKINEK
jgi:calcineurin-like phosphoesterase family protein